MSRILDALERIGRESSAPMGFSNTTRETKRRSMVILGCFSLDKGIDGQRIVKKNTSSLPLKLDGALVSPRSLEGFEEIIAPLKNVPWGVELPELKTKKMYGQWRKKGADFFVGDPEHVNVKVLEDEGTGFFLRIQPDLKDRYLRTIESLPVDGVIVSGGGLPITLQKLMDLSALRTMLDKYLLLETSSTISKRELESFLHIGVDGLLVDMSWGVSKSDEKLIKYLDDIPSLSVGKSGRSTALLPHEPYASESSSSQEEEGEEF